ncbi:MAG: MFS transporter, partial [Sulfurimonadaceae bacterium]|nr:MFS transporter [Sulfurimonadaceae bacterium]
MKALFSIFGVLPFTLVAFINAFTDLGHKIIIQNTVFKVYDGDVQVILTAIVNALILLPYILVFSPSGYLSDRFAKHTIMRYSALFAVIITLAITLCYYQGWFFSAFGLTFMLALQSAIYGPAKYGYIKELLGAKNLTAGNALIQATTTVAILGGIIFYTFLFEMRLDDISYTKEEILQVVAPLGWLLVIGSVIELYLSFKLPNKMGEKTSRDFKFKRYIKGAYLFKNIKVIKRKKEIFQAIIALSLFWSISQVVLAIFGEYAKGTLGVTNALMVQGVMALAGVGIVVGSVMASGFSKYYIQTGLAPIGALGIAVIVFLVPSIGSMVILAMMFMLFGVFAGFLMVPLNALVQYLSPHVHLGTILAGNNFIQNIFMFCFLILTSVFAYLGTNTTILFYFMGFVALWLFGVTARSFGLMGLWIVFEMMAKMRYRIHYIGLENITSVKRALVLGNHVSWVDWLLLQIPNEKRLHFMMDKDIYKWKIFHPLLKQAKVIPISNKASKDGFLEAGKRLENDNLVALFPEGEIAKTAELGKFYKGYEIIANRFDGAIVPFFITGLEGSLFAKYKDNKKYSFMKKRDVYIYFGAPLSIKTSTS